MTALLGRMAAVGMFAAALGACAVSGVGVGVDVGYAGGYYEPYGYDYGGWGGGYRVAPWGYGHRDERGGGPPRRAPYRPAPSVRPMPSIPNRARGR